MSFGPLRLQVVKEFQRAFSASSFKFQRTVAMELNSSHPHSKIKPIIEIHLLAFPLHLKTEHVHITCSHIKETKREVLI